MSLLSKKFLVFSAAVLAAASMASSPVAAHDGLDRYVYVPNRDSADVAVIDSRTDKVISRISVGMVPHQVLVAPTLGKLVSTNTADDTITIADLATGATVATLALGDEPEHMALGPDGVTLAVGNFAAGTVSIVSLAEDRELRRVAGLFEPHNLTFSPDGTRIYVGNLGADFVSVIDVAAGRVVEEIPIGAPKAVAALAGGDAEYQGVINVTATLDGRLGFAAYGEGDAMAVIELSSGRTVKTIALGDTPWRAYASADGRYMVVPNNGDETVSVVSTDTLEEVARLPGAADMTGVNGDPAGRTAFVLSRGANEVVLIDLDTLASAGTITLPAAPETGVVTPDGSKLYIALAASDQVAVIDVAARRLSGLIDDVGSGPWGTFMVGASNYCH